MGGGGGEEEGSGKGKRRCLMEDIFGPNPAGRFCGTAVRI